MKSYKRHCKCQSMRTTRSEEEEGEEGIFGKTIS